MKKISLAITILLILLTNISEIYGQTIYKDGDWVGVSSKVADGYIEMNVERYKLYPPVSDNKWYIIGGDTVPSYNTNDVIVVWDNNAKSYSIIAYNSNGNITVDLKKDVAFNITWGDGTSEAVIKCADQTISLSANLFINSTSPVYKHLATKIKWLLKDPLGNIVKEISTKTYYNNYDITDEYQFTPKSIGVFEGNYFIVAECWRYNDEEPFYTSNGLQVTINKAAPKFTDMLVIKKSITGKSLASVPQVSYQYQLLSFIYENQQYYIWNSFPENLKFNYEGEFPDGEPIWGNKEVASWGDLNQISSDESYNFTKYAFVRLIFREISGNGCASIKYYDNIPTAEIDFNNITIPSCFTETGSFTLNNVNNESYTLYKIDNISLNSVEKTETTNYILSTDATNKTRTYSDLSSGEYILLIASPPFFIEEYIDLRAPVYNFTLSSKQPSCAGGSDGKITIENLSKEYTVFNTGTDNFERITDSGIDNYNYTYTVYDENNAVKEDVISGNIPFEITGMQSGSWYVTVKENGCESDREEIEVNETTNTPIVLTFENKKDLVDCINMNGQISVLTTGGYQDASISYTITGSNNYKDNVTDLLFNNGSNSYTFDNLANATYSIIVTDFCNETGGLSDITIEPAPKPNIGSDDVSITPALCYLNTGQITLNSFTFDNVSYSAPAGDFSYFVWEYGISPDISNFSAETSFTLNSKTPYYLFVKHDNTQCISPPYEFEIPAPDTLELKQEIIPATCANEGNVTLIADITGGTAPYNLIWKYEDDSIISSTTTDNKDSIEVFEASNYTLAITDAHDCALGKIPSGIEPALAIYKVQRPQELSVYTELIVPVDSAGKSNGSVSLGTDYNESSVMYSIDGINFSYTPVFNGLSEGYYTFYIRNQNFCLDSITNVYVGTVAPFAASIKSVNNISCKNAADGKIEITATGGVKPYRFKLVNSLGMETEQADSVFTNLFPDTYRVYAYYNTYEYYLQDVSISEPEEILLSINSGDAVCGQETGWASVHVSGGTAPYTYIWSNDKTVDSITNLAAANYSVRVSDINACEATIETALNDPKGPQLTQTTSTPVPCSYSTGGGSVSLSLSGGVAPYTFSWQNVDIISDHYDASTGLYNAYDLAPGSYTVTVTDSTGCPYSLNNVFVPAPEKLTAVPIENGLKNPTCYGGSDAAITVQATGGTAPYTFYWTDFPNIDTNHIDNLSAGIYELRLSDSHNCADTLQFELQNPEQINIDLEDSVFLCSGQTAVLDAGNPEMDHEWVSENGFYSTEQIVYLQDAGDYIVTLTNDKGCTQSKKVHIKYENRLLEGGFLISSQATMADTVVLIEISWPVPDSLQWSIPEDFYRLVDGDSYKELIPLNTGTYTISMKAFLDGCTDIVEKQITIVPAGTVVTKQLAQETELIKSAKLYPNPNTGRFELEVKLSEVCDIRIDVFDMNGFKTVPSKLETGMDNYLSRFNLMNLQPGVYFINIIAKNEIKKLKFIVR